MSEDDEPDEDDDDDDELRDRRRLFFFLSFSFLPLLAGSVALPFPWSCFGKLGFSSSALGAAASSFSSLTLESSATCSGELRCRFVSGSRLSQPPPLAPPSRSLRLPSQPPVSPLLPPRLSGDRRLARAKRPCSRRSRASRSRSSRGRRSSRSSRDRRSSRSSRPLESRAWRDLRRPRG